MGIPSLIHVIEACTRTSLNIEQLRDIVAGTKQLISLERLISVIIKIIDSNVDISFVEVSVPSFFQMDVKEAVDTYFAIY